jgi:hypothetical protein
LRWTAGFAVTTCAVLAFVSSAPAATVSFSGSLRANVVDLFEGGLTLVGELDRTAGKDVAVQIMVRQTASGGYRGTVKAYEGRGSLSGRVELDSALSPTGRVLTDGTITMSRSTGMFGEPTGTLRMHASTNADTGLTEGSVSGQVRFRPAHLSRLPTPADHRFAARLLGVSVGERAGVEAIVAQVRGMTARSGLIILKTPAAPGTALASWTHFDALGTISGRTPLSRVPEDDGDLTLKPGRSRMTGGTGRYRRVEGVRALMGRPGRWDHVSTFFRFGLDGELRY